MRNFLLLLCLFASARLQAADAGKRYLKLKDDSDLYVGEGVADKEEFKGNGLKALEAARERARAALASSIRVRITSETTESSKGGTQGSSEEISSKSKSLADVVLENIHTEDYVDFPEKGKFSALAYVSKEDYRRQLAGRATPIYRPQFGLKIGLWGPGLAAFDTIENSGTINGPPKDFPLNPASGNGGGDSGGGLSAGYGLEFVWGDYSMGFDLMRKNNTALYVFDPVKKGYDVLSDGLGVWMFSLGWQYIPWNWRVQPFFPLGVHAGSGGWYQYQAFGTALSAGAGLRYWPSDGFSFEASFRYLQGLSRSTFMKDGVPLRLRSDQEAEFILSGAQGRVAIQWSGF